MEDPDEKIATGSLGGGFLAGSLDAQGEFLEPGVGPAPWKFLVEMKAEKRDTASSLPPPPSPSQDSRLHSVKASCSFCSWQGVHWEERAGEIKREAPILAWYPVSVFCPRSNFSLPQDLAYPPAPTKGGLGWSFVLHQEKKQVL